MTRLAPWTRSIAPPIPLTIFPGIIQLAMSPPAETCIAPRIAASILPPRLLPQAVAAAEHAEGRCGVEVRRAPTDRHGLLAGIDQVGVDLVLSGIGTDAEDAVLG